MSFYKILNIKEEDYKNIYAVGDIHGMFHLLEEELEKINFNKKEDLLISVGDLIDRGKNSIQAIDYLDKNWFVSVFGNHDYKFMELPSKEHYYLFPEKEYFDEVLSIENKNKFIKKYNEKLYAGIEIELKNNEKIAVVHAEIPFGYTWKDFKESLLEGELNAIKQSIWGRSFANLYKLKKLYEENNLDEKTYNQFIFKTKLYNDFYVFDYLENDINMFPFIMEELDKKIAISDLKASIHGHSIVSNEGSIINLKNRYFIDTGAFLKEEFIIFNENKKNDIYIPNRNNNYKLSIINIKDI